jgi:hypothetical protein
MRIKSFCKDAPLTDLLVERGWLNRRLESLFSSAGERRILCDG